MLLTVSLLAASAGAAILRVGPTRPFANIQAAVNAANASGDLILVDAGAYSPFDIVGKGVAILSDSAAFTITPSATRPAIRISSIAMAQSVMVGGFSTNVAFGGAAVIQMVACSGPVHLVDATITPTVSLTNVPMRAVIEAELCLSLWLENVNIVPLTPKQGTTSNPITAPNGPDAGISAVILQDSVLLAQRSQWVAYDNLGTGIRYAGDAVRMFGATSVVRLHFMDLIQGGAGSTYGGSCVHEPGVGVEQGAFSYGTSSSAYVPGAGAFPGGFWAIGWDRGVAFPGVDRFIPAALFASAGTVTAGLRATLGSVHNVTLDSFFARRYALFLGPTRVDPAIGSGIENTRLLDFTLPILAATGVLPALPATAVISFTVPNNSALAGLQLGAQMIMGPPLGQTVPPLSWSTGAIMVAVP